MYHTNNNMITIKSAKCALILCVLVPLFSAAPQPKPFKLTLTPACDGTSDDTKALQAALDHGHLVIPSNRTCLSQPLTLRSHSILVLNPGGVLKAGRKWDDGTPFLYGQNVTNVTILGRSGGGGGTIDGSGAQWWTGSNKTPNRPKMLQIEGGKDILLDGFSLLNPVLVSQAYFCLA